MLLVLYLKYLWLHLHHGHGVDDMSDISIHELITILFALNHQIHGSFVHRDVLFGLTTISCLSYHSHLYSSSRLNSYHDWCSIL